MSKNITLLSARKGLNNNLFEALSNANNVDAPAEARKKIAAQFLLGEATLKGATSFYDFIEGENAAMDAYFCDGSSCLCAGTQKTVEEKLRLSFGENNVGHVACLGRCHENSAFQVKGVNYSGEDIHQLEKIIQQGKASEESLPVISHLDKPVLTAEIGNLAQYYQLFEQHKGDKKRIFSELSLSGLRGRGGAGFPAAIKWQACADSTANNSAEDEKYIVCNADEGDPGAFSDRYLLEQRPHHVLFGMLLAGWLTGAKNGVLYIRDEYPEAIESCAQAIAELKALDINLPFQFKIIKGAGAYICGEETALLRSIEGQRPMVSVRPPFPAQQGLFNCPTVVNNVETFACIHWILEQGAQAFKLMGTEKSSGTKLLSLDSSFNQPGIVEVAMGTPLKTVVEQLGQGFSRPTKALHIGGPLGGLVPIQKISDLNIDFESFSEQGFLLGHGSIIGLPEKVPLMAYLHHLFEFTAVESCGKCFPCRLGATRGREMFENAIDQTQLLNRSLLDDLLETMELGSLCALGGGIPLPVKNALRWFSEELSPYFEKESD